MVLISNIIFRAAECMVQFLQFPMRADFDTFIQNKFQLWRMLFKCLKCKIQEIHELFKGIHFRYFRIYHNRVNLSQAFFN